MDPFSDQTLDRLPTTIRLLFTATLMTMGMGYLFALANLGLAIGFTPVKIVEHYWGNEATQAEMRGENQATEDVEEEMSFDDFAAEEDEAEPILAIPSFSSLVAEVHFHLLSYAMLFFICGLILSFARLEPLYKNTLILAPFAASVLDIWSIFFTRFIGPGFAWMLMIAGTIMATSFALVFAVSIYQMWFLKSEKEG